MIKSSGGNAKLKTLESSELTAGMNGAHNIVIKNAKAEAAHISAYDVRQSNGIIQVIDQVLLPPKS